MPSSPSFVSRDRHLRAPVPPAPRRARRACRGTPRRARRRRRDGRTRRVSVSIGRTTSSPSTAHGPVDDAPDGEDRRLRRVDDRLERVDAVHAEVRDRERAALDVLGAEPAARARLDDLDAGAPRSRASSRRSASCTTGTTSPSSVATAIADVDAAPGTIEPSRHDAFTRGWRRSASAQSLTSRSVWLTRSAPGRARTASRQLSSRDASTSRARKKCGTVLPRRAVVRSAITPPDRADLERVAAVRARARPARSLDVGGDDRAVGPLPASASRSTPRSSREPARLRRREPSRARRAPALAPSTGAAATRLDRSHGRGCGRAAGARARRSRPSASTTAITVADGHLGAVGRA